MTSEWQQAKEKERAATVRVQMHPLIPQSRTQRESTSYLGTYLLLPKVR